MKLGVMQPYAFPYIGYFQLMAHSDVFVLYDDVNFIERGWINRNNLLSREGADRFTIPLAKATCNRHINEILIQSGDGKWIRSFLRGLEMRYSKAPQKEPCLALLTEIYSTIGSETSISKFVLESLSAINRYLGIDTQLVESSTLTYDRSRERAGKVCSIAAVFPETDTLCFPPGSRSLYTEKDFPDFQCEVILPEKIDYPQFARNSFIPNLSIIDILMFNNVTETLHLLSQYQVVGLEGMA